MKSYKANWEIQGLPGKKVLPPGAPIMLEEEIAAGLVKCGALSPCADSECNDSVNSPSSAIDRSIDLSGMNKAQLVEYGYQKLGLNLDINKKKDDLLAIIAEASGK